MAPGTTSFPFASYALAPPPSMCLDRAAIFPSSTPMSESKESDDVATLAFLMMKSRVQLAPYFETMPLAMTLVWSRKSGLRV